MSQGILLIEIVGSLQLRMQAGGVAGLGKWVIGTGNRNDPDGANLNALQTRAVYMHQTPQRQSNDCCFSTAIGDE
jgi:hypothetical protein